MKNQTIVITLALSLLAIVGESFCQTGSNSNTQNGANSQNSGRQRFVLLKNDVCFIRLDTQTGQSWVLKSSRNENQQVWVPLKQVSSLESAKAWLQEEQKQRAQSETRLDRKKFSKWATQVLLKPEYGNAKSAVRRWKSPPRISIFGGDEKHKKIVESSIKKINSVLGQTRFGKIKLVDDDDQEAELRVYLTSVRNFLAIAKKHEFKIPQYNEGYFALKWDSKNELLEGQVLIAIDRLRGQQLEHIVLEEITQALGPTNDSDMFRSSIFFSGRSFPTDLSERDKILLKMLYTNLKPNDKKSQVERAIRNVFHKLEKHKKTQR